MLGTVRRPLRPGVSDSFPYPTRMSGGDVPIAYFDVGSGPVLLLIHGLGSNFTHFQLVAPGLARHHRVVGIDLPGCGDSAKPRMRYTIDGYIDACVRLLDELQIPQATWVGHSLGGMVSAGAALRWPRRVERLVLIAGAGFTRYPLMARLGSHVLPSSLILLFMKRFARKLLYSCFHDVNHHAKWFIGQAEGRPESPTLDEFARVTASLLPDVARRHYLDEIEKILQPTLVIWGEQDRLLPFEPVRDWADRLPNGRLSVFRNCGHLPIIERPDEVVEELHAFLNEGRMRTFAAG